ncbi:MAG: AbrB/MazE/SpoVT family DNA-binding domain-containing protein [Thermofilaceae archaeon]|nr:AbrB/MazE/SpoVT family DNA-binding domain-containing protein [Thermofilaceae archaeon]MCX8179825.1 AbrB/MazE/SpoVT family DNA-binding domain-containing protein [Thermofilaceae archaeon]MDW8004351.1 AbrB/MazE/SpoVT family DNA-binding domain-containing protein [Thermofilaceae archaeon]
MVEAIVKVDERGRVLIPANIRKMLKIKSIVKLVVEGDKIVLKPLEDPLKQIEELVVKGVKDVEVEIPQLRKVAEEELLKGV